MDVMSFLINHFYGEILDSQPISVKEKEGGSSATGHHWSAATSSLDTEICCTSNQSCLTDCLTANLVTGKMTLPFFHAHQNTAKYFSILVLFVLNTDFFLSL